MKYSHLVIETVKDAPSDAKIKSHILLSRAGFIKQLTSGIYTLGMPALKISQKIENIIRQEMNALDGQEVKFPVVMNRELWDETGRYTSIGSEMVRFKDKGGRDMLLGMTHEEASVDFARAFVKSSQKFPFMIYQIQTKVRDELRSRGGLIRVREFTMKDAYSFHLTRDDLQNYYKKQYDAYYRIFRRIGMKNVVAVASDSGMMGGKVAHEFMLVCDAGEDTLVLCDKCGYAANAEVAEGLLEKQLSKKQELKLVDVGKNTSIEKMCDFLKVKPSQTCKAVCFAIKGDLNTTVVAFIRGDLDVNETKLQTILKKEIVATDALDASVFAPGYIGPIGLTDKNVIKVYDVSLKDEENLVCGANKAPFHYTGLSVSRDLKNIKFEDFSMVSEGMTCKTCGEGKLSFKRGIEVGNIFDLGTKYTESMKMQITLPDGNKMFPVMGCYGIGVGRAIASIAEELADEKGLVWPYSVAPWQVHICALQINDEKVRTAAFNLYGELKEKGIDVLIDDRDTSPGKKFADADLLGMPIRVVISPRSLENEQFEIVFRQSKNQIMLEIKDATDKIINFIKDEVI